MEYFSDKEEVPQPRIKDYVTAEAWGGIVAVIESLISNGAFGEAFPEICDDGNVIIGTNPRLFRLNLQAEIPKAEWPFKTEEIRDDNLHYEMVPIIPNTLVALDLVQFCFKYVSEPVSKGYHDYFKHYHLYFDDSSKWVGQESLRAKINEILARNGIAFELKEDGNIERLLQPILQEVIANKSFSTGDSIIDEKLEKACGKFLNVDLSVRKESLELLWDAWERLKTILDPSDKKKSMTDLLDKVASERNIRQLLEEEAVGLTRIGNNFHIRHFETNKTEITEAPHIDYLFHRMMAMIYLLIKQLN